MDKKVNRGQLRTLRSIFDDYCRVLAPLLSGYLRVAATAEVISVEEMLYSEFVGDLSNPCLLSVVELEPLKGLALVELSSNIGNTAIDRLLGGSGTDDGGAGGFSEIEKNLLKRIVIQMLRPLPEVWSGVATISPRHLRIETNARLAQIAQPSDNVVLAATSIKVGMSEGLLNFCMPVAVMEPVLCSPGISDCDETEDENVDVTAVIGRAFIAESDFAKLAVGDVIPLNAHADSDLEIFVGSLKKFYGKPGVSRGKNAVRIAAVSEKE